MKKNLIPLLALGASLLVVSSAQATLTGTYWNTFGTFSGGVSTADTTGSEFSSASLTASASTASIPITGGGNTGGGANFDFLKMTGTAVNNSTLSFSLTANGIVSLTALNFDYKVAPSYASPQSIAWTYTISGGGGSGGLGTTTISVNGGLWTSASSIDLSSISSVANGATITITGTLDNLTVAGGFIGFDNIQITAVPEPTNYALAGFGLIFVGGGVGRFYIARRRSSPAS